MNRPDVPYRKLNEKIDLPAEAIPDLDANSIKADLGELQAMVRSDYTVEWGTRASDGALVLHFFPKVDGDNVATAWDEAYKMDKRLEYALPLTFDTRNLTAGFEKDYNSFYVIVSGIISLDPRLLVQTFLDRIEAAPIR